MRRTLGLATPRAAQRAETREAGARGTSRKTRKAAAARRDGRTIQGRRDRPRRRAGALLVRTCFACIFPDRLVEGPDSAGTHVLHRPERLLAVLGGGIVPEGLVRIEVRFGGLEEIALPEGAVDDMVEPVGRVHPFGDEPVENEVRGEGVGRADPDLVALLAPELPAVGFAAVDRAQDPAAEAEDVLPVDRAQGPLDVDGRDDRITPVGLEAEHAGVPDAEELVGHDVVLRRVNMKVAGPLIPELAQRGPARFEPTFI